MSLGEKLKQIADNKELEREILERQKKSNAKRPAIVFYKKAKIDIETAIESTELPEPIELPFELYSLVERNGRTIWNECELKDKNVRLFGWLIHLGSEKRVKKSLALRTI